MPIRIASANRRRRFAALALLGQDGWETTGPLVCHGAGAIQLGRAGGRGCFVHGNHRAAASVGGILTWAGELQGVPVHSLMLGPDKAAVTDTPKVALLELRGFVSIPQVVFAAFQASERPRLPPPQCE